MCEISKQVGVQTIREHLIRIANGLKDVTKVDATLVMDEKYSSMTAIVDGKVLCINFMQ